MIGVLGGCDESTSPFIHQPIAIVSLILQVNTAGDPRHVVTLVGLVVKIADPEEDIKGKSGTHLLCGLPRWLTKSGYKYSHMLLLIMRSIRSTGILSQT